MSYLTPNEWIHKIFWRRWQNDDNDDEVLDKYNEIWDKIKPKLKIKFHSTPVYDEKG